MDVVENESENDQNGSENDENDENMEKDSKEPKEKEPVSVIEILAQRKKLIEESKVQIGRYNYFCHKFIFVCLWRWGVV
jgi:hypothetical protein